MWDSRLERASEVGVEGVEISKVGGGGGERAGAGGGEQNGAGCGGRRCGGGPGVGWIRGIS